MIDRGAPPTVRTRLVDRVRSRVSVLYREAAKFLAIGGAGYIVDVSVFNILRLGVLADQPLTAKVLSVTAATAVTFSGNRLWTFRHRRHGTLGAQYLMFTLLNVIGMGIAVAVLAISHYGLGYTSALADNIAANVVGLGLGTIFRFWSYRRWVFRQPLAGAVTH